MEKLAKIAETTVGTVSNHEKHGVTSIEYVLRYCEALGCEPSDLLADNVDLEKFSLKEDITSFYPWNLARAVIGDKEDAIYRVYVPALMEAISDLTDREQKVLELRFIHDMTYGQCGHRFNVTRERIRQIEAKALRKLRHPRFAKHYLLDTLNKAFEIDAERARLERENMMLREKLEKHESIPKPKVEPKKIDIAYMELSVRSYNCLKRAGFNFVDDLDGKTVSDLKKVRDLGMKSLREVVEKAREFGIEIPWEDET